jgi:Tryptophan-rich sensory protein (mitochondrial benzodiazepine receptor homolog)
MSYSGDRPKHALKSLKESKIPPLRQPTGNISIIEPVDKNRRDILSGGIESETEDRPDVEPVPDVQLPIFTEKRKKPSLLGYLIINIIFIGILTGILVESRADFISEAYDLINYDILIIGTIVIYIMLSFAAYRVAILSHNTKTAVALFLLVKVFVLLWAAFFFILESVDTALIFAIAAGLTAFATVIYYHKFCKICFFIAVLLFLWILFTIFWSSRYSFGGHGMITPTSLG